jgi:glucose/arabinose dehydrogenase
MRSRTLLRFARFTLASSAFVTVGIAACSSGDAGSPGPGPEIGDGSVAPFDANMLDVVAPGVVVRGAPPPLGDFCSLPGSVVWSGGAPTTVPGGDAPEDVSWLHLPDGFCAHYYANVPHVRQLRFSPSGDLFAASPSVACAGGEANEGVGAILVLPDDDHDGAADSQLHYVDLPVTQGLLFAGGYFYYQDDQQILRVPYKNGDRAAPSTAPEPMIDITSYYSSTHWPKALDVDDHGNIFVTNGGDQSSPDETCLGPRSTWQYRGSVFQIDGTPDGRLVATGFRNPIALRCAKGTGACFGLELARDFSPAEGSREKLFPVRLGDDWGQPCCATQNLPFTDSPAGTNCSAIASEIDSFTIDHTPFGLDFEQGAFPAPWQYDAFVVLHGYVGSWVGARIVGVPTDPTSGWPLSAVESAAGSSMTDFATGWYVGNASTAHGRPGSITFAPDGRMFVGNDWNGDILWISPVVAPSGGT